MWKVGQLADFSLIIYIVFHDHASVASNKAQLGAVKIK